MKRSIERSEVQSGRLLRSMFVLPLAVLGLSACSHIGFGISLPIGGIGSMGVGVGGDGRVSGGVAVGRGGASVGVGGTLDPSRSAPAPAEPAASASRR